MIEDRNLKPGTVLVARYKKAQHRCEVVAGEDGKVVFRIKGGKEYGSPSAAGSAVMGGTACNGWRFWSLEGQELTAKPARTPKAGKKAGAKAKAAPKPKRAAKARKPSNNGAAPAAKIACGQCRETFATTDEASQHLAEAHPQA